MRLLGPAAKIVQAVTTAVTPVLAAVRPRRRPDGDPWDRDDARRQAVNAAERSSWLPPRPDLLRGRRPRG